jgi:hypothetical protein
MDHGFVYIECLRGDDILATYEFPIDTKIGMSDSADVANMINQAKSRLVTLGMIEPTSKDITYKVRY